VKIYVEVKFEGKRKDQARIADFVDCAIEDRDLPEGVKYLGLVAVMRGYNIPKNKKGV